MDEKSRGNRERLGRANLDQNFLVRPLTILRFIPTRVGNTAPFGPVQFQRNSTVTSRSHKIKNGL
jgi:hypothetical protein